MATPGASREFDRLPETTRKRFLAAFDRLEAGLAGLDVAALQGAPGSFRLRVGRYRGIYRLEPGVIVFTRFGHRSTVYR